MTTIAIAHPSADLYGADLQLLETVDALVGSGAEVVVAIGAPGPLVGALEERGARVAVVRFPVLRKAALRPLPFLRLLGQIAASVPRMLGFLRRERADALLVNTITIPWWLLAGRLRRLRTVGHVHEAEHEGRRIVRTLLALPNLLATTLVVNSRASAEALTDVVPILGRRIEVVHNGVPGPPFAPEPVRARTPDDPLRVAVVGRLSPRKGTDVAVEAAEVLLSEGVDLTLDLYGTAFEGYEWFEQQVRDRAAGLDGRVTFHGYVNPVWQALADADVVLVPSRVEPFGNTAVEALLAARPLIASDTQGLAEIVTDGRTGLLVPPGDVGALAAAIRRIALDPGLGARLAEQGRQEALDRFGTARYRRRMSAALGLGALPEGPDRTT